MRLTVGEYSHVERMSTYIKQISNDKLVLVYNYYEAISEWKETNIFN